MYMLMFDGQVFHAHLSANGRIYKIHIVKHIENDMIVFKWYGKHKQWWHYQVETRKSVEYMIERAFELKEKE